MTLEDIPGMQVVEGHGVGSLVESPDMLIDFEGKFVSIKGPGDKLYVFAEEGSPEHQEIFKRFIQRAKEVYHMSSVGETSENSFSATGGGFLTIYSTEVVLSGRSQAFGNYKREDIEPIAKEWQRQNLPNHSLVFR